MYFNYFDVYLIAISKYTIICLAVKNEVKRYEIYELTIIHCWSVKKRKRREIFLSPHFMLINLCFAVLAIIANINTHYWFSSFFPDDTQNGRNKPYNLVGNAKVLLTKELLEKFWKKSLYAYLQWTTLKIKTRRWYKISSQIIHSSITKLFIVDKLLLRHFCSKK